MQCSPSLLIIGLSCVWSNLIQAQEPSPVEELPPPAALEPVVPQAASDATSSPLDATQSILEPSAPQTSASNGPGNGSQRQSVASPTPSTTGRDQRPLVPPPVPDFEALRQGPVHEAFGTPTHTRADFTQPTVVPSSPPKRLNEQRPPKPPGGKQLLWVDGYWLFDSVHEQYVWVTGFYREVPPGRTWIAGEWHEVDGGFARTPGYWGELQVASAQFLPQPPEPRNSAPDRASRNPDSFWMPGQWRFEDGQYTWQAGYWTKRFDDWLWQPACYLWTPQGFVYVSGYWDYEPTIRGVPYAPLAFYRPLYEQPGFSLRPQIPLATATELMLHLFTSPAYRGFLWGDFYSESYAQQGLSPWYAVEEESFPSIGWGSYYRWKYAQSGIDFERAMLAAYEAVVSTPAARPMGPPTLGSVGAAGVRIMPAEVQSSFDAFVRKAAGNDLPGWLASQQNQVPTQSVGSVTPVNPNRTAQVSPQTTNQQQFPSRDDSLRENRRQRQGVVRRWPASANSPRVDEAIVPLVPVPFAIRPPSAIRPPFPPVPPGLPGIAPSVVRPPIFPFGTPPAGVPRPFGGRFRR